MKIESTAITHIGLVRTSNEDNYYVNGKCKTNHDVAAEGYSDNLRRDTYLYAVCDGMGGESYGELASMIAVKTLTRYQETDIRRSIYEYIKRANRYICDELAKFGARSGTTLALLYFFNNKAVSYNVGDSRVYLSRKGDLYLLSEDHTEAQRLVNMGLLSEDEAATHNSKNKLTQHLGISSNELVIEPYVSEDIKVKKNDIFMICSDGLTNMLSDDDIGIIMAQKNADTSEIAKELASAAQEYGGRDNTTVIVIKIV